MWIGKMITKAAEGTWSDLTSTAARLLAKALAYYFGLPVPE